MGMWSQRQHSLECEPGGGWELVPPALSGLVAALSSSVLMFTPGVKGTPGWQHKNFICFVHMLPALPGETIWEAHPGAHFSPSLLSKSQILGLKIKPALASIWERPLSGCPSPPSMAGRSSQRVNTKMHVLCFYHKG